MAIVIPRTTTEPPDWFPSVGRPAWIPSVGQPNFDLNDIRWSGAVKHTLGEAGTSSSSFRALHYTNANGNSFIYLTFRAKFVQTLDFINDSVFLGLHKRGSEEAMVIQMDAHAATNMPGGPRSADPPHPFFSGKLWKASFDVGNNDWGIWQLTQTTKSALPRWIQDSAYVWLQQADPAVLADQARAAHYDQNNRWAIQLLIPITTQPTADDSLSLDLDSDFDMWCLVRSALSTGAIVIHGENRTDGLHTKYYDLTHDLHPKPSIWEQFKLSNDPLASGDMSMDDNVTGRARLVRSNIHTANFGVRLNMHFDQGPLIEREVEISGRGDSLYPSKPADVYLAVEKMNLPRHAPPGTNEGRFLESSMKRLIAQGGLLADKLKNAQARLSDEEIYSSASRLKGLLAELHPPLAEIAYRKGEQGSSVLHQLIRSLSRWLSTVKEHKSGAKQLARLFDALADWLLASDHDAAAKLSGFITGLSQWLSSLTDDPASSELVPSVLQALRAWLSTLADGSSLVGPTATLENWLASDRGVKRLPAILSDLRESLSSLLRGNKNLRVAIASVLQGIARWLNGYERLDAFVSVLSDVGLTEDELDQLFPTFRVYVYRETGERTKDDGKESPVLEPQTSFGYFVYHEGDLYGWDARLKGAEQAGESLYLLKVPDDGAVMVNTRIQAVESDNERTPIPDPTQREEPCGCLCQIFRLLRFGKKT